MNAATVKNAAIAAAALAGLFVVAWVWRNGLGAAAAKIAGGAVDAAAGAVVGIGEAVGIPMTDAEKCAAAKNYGDGWAASKYCPAGDFLAWSAKRVFGTAAGAGGTLVDNTADGYGGLD